MCKVLELYWELDMVFGSLKLAFWWQDRKQAITILGEEGVTCALGIQPELLD